MSSDNGVTVERIKLTRLLKCSPYIVSILVGSNNYLAKDQQQYGGHGMKYDYIHHYTVCLQNIQPLARYSPAEVTAKRKGTTPHNGTIIISKYQIKYLLSLDSSYLERSREISEIDARLKALQEFMKKSLEPSKHHKK